MPATSTTRAVSPAGVKLIQKFEAFSPDVYLCPAGLPTIGWGHVIRKTDRIVPPITPDQAYRLLREDLAAIEIYLTGVLPALTQGQFDACASLAFNIGLGAFEKSTLMKMLRAGDVSGAAEQFGRWINSNGKPLGGLVRRRAAERRLFLEETT